MGIYPNAENIENTKKKSEMVCISFPNKKDKKIKLFAGALIGINSNEVKKIEDITKHSVVIFFKKGIY